MTPSTGEARRVPGRSALAVGETIAVVCAEDCRTVDVLGRDGGRTARLRMAETVTAAVVAPDERAIALLTKTELATAALVIVDRDAETMQSVTNGVAARLMARGLTWSRDGAWLFFPTATGRIGVVERATGRVSVVDAEVGARRRHRPLDPRRMRPLPRGRWAIGRRSTPSFPIHQVRRGIRRCHGPTGQVTGPLGVRPTIRSVE